MAIQAFLNNHHPNLIITSIKVESLHIVAQITCITDSRYLLKKLATHMQGKTIDQQQQCNYLAWLPHTFEYCSQKHPKQIILKNEFYIYSCWKVKALLFAQNKPMCLGISVKSRAGELDGLSC